VAAASVSAVIRGLGGSSRTRYRATTYLDGDDVAADGAVVADSGQVGSLVEVWRVVVGDHVDRYLSLAAQLLHRLVIGRSHLHRCKQVTTPVLPAQH